MATAMTDTNPARRAVILDLGKTRAKLSVLDCDGTVLATQDAPAQEFRQATSSGVFDVENIARWCESALAALYRQFPFAHLIAVTHGATAVSIDRNGAPNMVRDYEADIDAELCGHYDQLRPAFAETGSPPLPCGLNLGRQLFQQQQAPEAFRDIRALLTYPQFWTWRWAGVLGTDISSLGCHTDLWQPHDAQWSSLAKQFGWDNLFPPLVEAGGAAGFLQNSIATLLQPTQPISVHWGVHDSNAALAAFLGDREPFTLLSTGTWLVAFVIECRCLRAPGSIRAFYGGTRTRSDCRQPKKCQCAGTARVARHRCDRTALVCRRRLLPGVARPYSLDAAAAR
jgi:L-fuculokinase